MGEGMLGPLTDKKGRGDTDNTSRARTRKGVVVDRSISGSNESGKVAGSKKLNA